MSKLQRIGSFLSGLGIFALSLVLIVAREKGVTLIVTVLAISLLIYSIRLLVYYYTMARYMVEGKRVLYQGVILLDLAIFMVALTNVPAIYVAIYLMIVNLFAAAIDIMKANDARKLKVGSWKRDMALSALELILPFTLVFKDFSADMLIEMYAALLMVAGFRRIADAFSRKEIVYIQ